MVTPSKDAAGDRIVIGKETAYTSMNNCYNKKKKKYKIWTQ